MSPSSTALTVIGILGLIHAGYSTLQYRSYLKLSDSDDNNMPFDIIVQCILSLLIASIGLVCKMQAFSPISATAKYNSIRYDHTLTRPSFFAFGHRGRNIN